MPTLPTVDPDTVRLLEDTDEKRVDAEFDWLPQADKEMRARENFEFGGMRVDIQSQACGQGVARVTVLGLDAPVTVLDLDRAISELAARHARTIRFRILRTEDNDALISRLRDLKFDSKLTAVHWLRSVEAQPADSTENYAVRRIESDELAEFARIVSLNYRSWKGSDLTPLIQESAAPHMACFLAYADNLAVATGRVIRVDSVCVLGYGSTLRAYRGRGIQQAVIAARVKYAREIGCSCVTADTWGNDRSSRNLVRQGFSRAYELAVFERTT